MNQLEYDIIEFVLLNKDEIKDQIESDISHLQIYKEFLGVHIFDELILEYRKHTLCEHLGKLYPNEFEHIILIVDNNLVKILYNNQGD
jgi:hypothetical protein